MHDTLQFLCELPIYKEEQPYELYGFPEQQSEKHTNCIFETKAVTVADVRNMNVAPQLEEHGFKFIQHISSCRPKASHFETVGGDKTVQLAYLEETIALVQDELKATKVICFDWRFRRYNPQIHDRIPPRVNNDIRNFALPTGDVVHCDYSAKGGSDRLKMQLLPEEIQIAKQNGWRAMIVNVWRPLNDVVCNTPLLLCDRRSVQREDLIEVDKVLSDKVEKSYFLFHRDYHHWYSLHNQRSDEIVMFLTWCMDSKDGETAGCSPHGAGASQEDGWADPRESVEVRLIVFVDSK